MSYFRLRGLENLLTVIKELAIAWILCGRLHAYNLHVVVNPIIVDGYASLFNCTTAVRASDSMTASS